MEVVVSDYILQMKEVQLVQDLIFHLIMHQKFS